MKFSAPLSLLALAGTAIANPISSPANPLVARDPATCFTNNVLCKGRQITIAEAETAIGNACAKITSCTPGGSPVTVTGTVPGYTATLIIGNQCAGVTTWSQAACKALFDDLINTPCQAIWGNADKYQCKCQKGGRRQRARGC